MDRRKFITYSSFSLLSVYALSVMPTEKKNDSKIQMCSEDIETSIKVNFGSGFKVIEHKQKDNVIEAKITHLENVYSVTNAPSGQWAILSSSIS